ncbi:hypothetical protein Ciccas_010665 [Cichlidogyrus casuarinus]|uniref:Uncharacterized protein n=1 Tax=Cichlidogyrus casuarinus TaxID=1844966 RepID=A0ABD2PY55_9PLAT
MFWMQMGSESDNGNGNKNLIWDLITKPKEKNNSIKKEEQSLEVIEEDDVDMIPPPLIFDEPGFQHKEFIPDSFSYIASISNENTALRQATVERFSKKYPPLGDATRREESARLQKPSCGHLPQCSHAGWSGHYTLF